jgi:hypothetical protein
MIHEDWVWVVVLSNVLGLMIIVGVAFVLYAAVTHDTASAFGFGAHFVAAITLLPTVKYWAWQEHS